VFGIATTLGAKVRKSSAGKGKNVFFSPKYHDSLYGPNSLPYKG